MIYVLEQNQNPATGSNGPMSPGRCYLQCDLIFCYRHQLCHADLLFDTRVFQACSHLCASAHVLCLMHFRILHVPSLYVTEASTQVASSQRCFSDCQWKWPTHSLVSADPTIDLDQLRTDPKSLSHNAVFICQFSVVLVTLIHAGLSVHSTDLTSLKHIHGIRLTPTE